jgi:hypothetical protein
MEIENWSTSFIIYLFLSYFKNILITSIDLSFSIKILSKNAKDLSIFLFTSLLPKSYPHFLFKLANKAICV